MSVKEIRIEFSRGRPVKAVITVGDKRNGHLAVQADSIEPQRIGDEEAELDAYEIRFGSKPPDLIKLDLFLKPWRIYK